MATLTIIKDDKFVAIDNEGYFLDAVDLPSNVHAIQWDGSAGWIEYNDGTANKTIDSISAYSDITDDHATKKTAVAAERQAEIDADTTLRATYAWKRQFDDTTRYADIGEQLDQLYHDMTAGKLDATGEWHKAIKAVKDANPKP